MSQGLHRGSAGRNHDAYSHNDPKIKNMDGRDSFVSSRASYKRSSHDGEDRGPMWQSELS